MTTVHLKTGVQPVPETSCISDIAQTVVDVQHSGPVMKQTISVTSVGWLCDACSAPNNKVSRSCHSNLCIKAREIKYRNWDDVVADGGEPVSESRT
jgi:hypothetical protein